MLTLHVVDHIGNVQSTTAQFDELGGTIGRGTDCTLVLPDPNRHISRTQASIVCRTGTYVLRDQGNAMPTLVNGTPVGRGNELPLGDGDEIRIGGYTLRASVHGRSSASAPDLIDDPFADLLDSPGTSSRTRSAEQMRGSQFSQTDDPFAPSSAVPAAPHGGTPTGIPQDFDVFDDLIPARASGQMAANTDGPDGNLTGRPAPKVDDIFGLRDSDPYSRVDRQNPLGSSSAHIPEELDSDLFRDLGSPSTRGRPKPASPQPEPSALSDAFRPPRLEPEAPQRPKHGASTGDGRSPRPVVSWDTETSPALDVSNKIKSVVVPSPKHSHAQPTVPSEHGERYGEEHTHSGAADFDAPSASTAAYGQVAAPRNARGSTAPARPDVLLEAFLRGCGIPSAPVGPLTPELMESCGQLLREAVRGTLDLLLARALTKREIRAQVTVIVARENNPLKFSPNVEAALTNLLAAQNTAFMTPTDAMRDAFNDLRSHEVGVMTGMRAALHAMLTRFAPSQLEQRLTRDTVLSSLLPGSRKARLWELYEQLYRQILKEAEDDFQSSFGREFLRAYEAQIDALDKQDPEDAR